MNKLEQERKNSSDLFPQPEDGAVLENNPIGFTWLPVSLGETYQLIVKKEDTNEKIVDEKTEKNYFIPIKPFNPGNYVWTLRAFDEKGNLLGERAPWTFTVPADAKITICPDAKTILQSLKNEHPMLVFSHDKLEQTRERIFKEQQEELQILKNTVLNAYEMGMPSPPDFHLKKTDQEKRMYYFEYFAYLRKYIDTNLVACSLYYLLTKDKQAGEFAKKMMLHVCAWNPEGPNAVDGPWEDEAGLSYSRCLHMCYDWTFNLYDNKEKVFVENTLIIYCRQTYRRLINDEYINKPGDSHVGRLPGYLGQQAILLHDKIPEAEEMLQYVLDVFNTTYPHFGGKDGGWGEGVSYASAYNRWYIPFFATIENITGFSFWDLPFYKKVKDFFIYCCIPNAENLPFGDGQENGPGLNEQRSAQFWSLFRFYAARFNDPVANWRAFQCVKPERFNFHIVENFIYPPAKSDISKMSIPNSKAFYGVGWAALHSNIKNIDEDNYLIFKSSPYGSVSHSHADQNSFCIASGGNMLAIASGYYGPKYGYPHHAEWTRHTKANNSILVNGEGQSVRDQQATGFLCDFSENEKYAYVSGDATAAYKGKLSKFIRKILFVKPNVFLIYDDLQAQHDSSFSWLLHSYEKPTINHDGKEIFIRRNDRKMQVNLFATSDLFINYTDKFDPPFNHGMMKEFHEDRPNQHHIRADTERVQSAKILAVVKVWHKEEPSINIAKNLKGIEIGGESFKVNVEMGNGKALIETEDFVL